MILADIITNLPKPEDEIKTIKRDIQQCYKQIDQLDKQVNINENQIISIGYGNDWLQFMLN